MATFGRWAVWHQARESDTGVARRPNGGGDLLLETVQTSLPEEELVEDVQVEAAEQKAHGRHAQPHQDVLHGLAIVHRAAERAEQHGEHERGDQAAYHLAEGR